MVSRDKQVLVVEDDLDHRELATLMFEMWGWQVTTAATAAEGLRQAAGGRFDLLLLDEGLPDGSGIDLARQIRVFDQRTPIIFFTASAFPQDKERALAAGAQAYITKPFDYDEIRLTVEHLLSGVISSLFDH
ncbi:MAG TPA: response regulator [Blastocatellia bacterium]|nr:response regulator [Blastocatellia bacterium]